MYDPEKHREEFQHRNAILFSGLIMAAILFIIFVFTVNRVNRSRVDANTKPATTTQTQPQ